MAEKTCPACRGSGQIRTKDGWRTCQLCDGSGKVAIF